MLGGHSENKNDADGLAKIAGWQSLVEGHSGKNFASFTPSHYTSQVVAGTNYQAAVDVGDGFIHVKIYEPLPGQGDPEVSGFKEGVNQDDAFDF